MSCRKGMLGPVRNKGETCSWFFSLMLIAFNGNQAEQVFVLLEFTFHITLKFKLLEPSDCALHAFVLCQESRTLRNLLANSCSTCNEVN